MVPRITKLTSIGLDATMPHQQLGLPRICSGRCVGLEALLLQARGGLAHGLVDAFKRLFARKGMVGEH
jgi:hypothetical protein